MSKVISVEEKIEYIEKTRSFGEIRQAWFPPSASTEYYFVSYCHADYKAVFRDLFGMQEVDPEFSVWYDRELIAGKDWKAEAEKHIYDFNCKGVIFYVSENSVGSPAVLEEMKMTRDAGKAFLPIVLPSSSGEYLSGEKLFERGKYSVDNSAVELYRTMLGKDITYLKLSDESAYKVDAIRKSLRGEPLLKFGRQSWSSDGDVLKVISCNNISATEVTLSDFNCADKKLAKLSGTFIGRCAFANCANLQSIELPKNVVQIDADAFLGCKSLRSIDLPKSLYAIGEYSFANCASLTELDLPDKIIAIPSFAFSGCARLKKVKATSALTHIGFYAFHACTALEEFDFGDIDEDSDIDYCLICDEAFSDCVGLRKIKLPFGLNEVSRLTFAGCRLLEEVLFPKTLIEIGVGAFRDCVILKSIDLSDCFMEHADADNFSQIMAVSNAVFSLGLRIEEEAFFNCSGSTTVRLPKKVSSIGKDAFSGTSVTDIYYAGTTDEWHGIDKKKFWDRGTPDYTVHCSDGDIKKG